MVLIRSIFRSKKLQSFYTIEAIYQLISLIPDSFTAYDGILTGLVNDVWL